MLTPLVWHVFWKECVLTSLKHCTVGLHLPTKGRLIKHHSRMLSSIENLKKAIRWRAQKGLNLRPALMGHALAALEALNCCKVNLQIRAGNDEVIAFNENLDFSVEELKNMGRKL